MIKIRTKGNFKRTDTFLEKILNLFKMGTFDKYGRAGVQALSEATPRDTGVTANSWSYVIDRSEGCTQIEWHNDNLNDGVNVAILIQYGHGLPQGGFVQGIDYINPALADIFDNMADELWEEVKRA